MSLNILLTSVGRRVELVRAFRRAYSELGLEGRIVAVDVDPLAPALQFVDRWYLVSRAAEPEYIPELCRICRREAIGLVFPLIDPEIPVLAAHRQTLEATGAAVAVVPPQAAAIAHDKWLTTRFFREHGLPTPRSWLPNDLDPDNLPYPVFLKPRSGSASADAFRVRDGRELAFLCGRVPDPIIQEYLPGPELTSDIICTPKGELLAIVSRKRIEVRWGEVAKGVTLHDARVLKYCAVIARALPACGPITVQCMMREGIPHFTEINARMGGGLPLAIAAGADAPRWLLARAAGLPIQIPPLGTYQAGLYLTRFDDSCFISQREQNTASEHRL